MSEAEFRTKSFKRNPSLEQLLKETNQLIGPANDKLATGTHEEYPKIFVVGPLRSGSTLFTQWLASSGLVSYPTNMLSRFYGAPLIGAKIQQLLTDPRYNFRDEILDFNSEINFNSENGKTKGAIAPNEFWYFWRRFLPFTDLDYMSDVEITAKADLTGLRDELNGLANVFEKPLALKAMIMNQNIPVLDALFDKAIFIWIKRDPVFNIQSALQARQRQYGDMKTWYGFKIREYPELAGLNPMDSVAGQIAAINQAVGDALSDMPGNRKLIVEYEQFCKQPAAYYRQLLDKLAAQGGLPDGAPDYRGEGSLQHMNAWRLDEYTQTDAQKAYTAMLDHLDATRLNAEA